jgi:hypothetical protein
MKEIPRGALRSAPVLGLCFVATSALAQTTSDTKRADRAKIAWLQKEPAQPGPDSEAWEMVTKADANAKADEQISALGRAVANSPELAVLHRSVLQSFYFQHFQHNRNLKTPDAPGMETLVELMSLQVTQNQRIIEQNARIIALLEAQAKK